MFQLFKVGLQLSLNFLVAEVAFIRRAFANMASSEVAHEQVPERTSIVSSIKKPVLKINVRQQQEDLIKFNNDLTSTLASEVDFSS